MQAKLAFRDRTLEAKPWVSLTALEISFDNPILHRNLSGSFERSELVRQVFWKDLFTTSDEAN